MWRIGGRFLERNWMMMRLHSSVENLGFSVNQHRFAASIEMNLPIDCEIAMIGIIFQQPFNIQPGFGKRPNFGFGQTPQS
jgi:hypothetical protein